MMILQALPLFPEIPGIDFNTDPSNVSNTLTIILLITILSIAPAILVMMTCFTRIVIVLGFVRTSLATQQMPPNQVIIGLALFLSLGPRKNPGFAATHRSRLNWFRKKTSFHMQKANLAVMHQIGLPFTLLRLKGFKQQM
jgi:flagellar biosynthesis protein FliP